MAVFSDYLSLLGEVQKALSQLTDIAQQKIRAVQQDDLNALDDCIKRDQVLSLSLRGYEQKRTALLKDLGLEGTTLRELPSRCPAELQPQATQICQSLRAEYDAYRAASSSARAVLECNLHEIEHFLAQQQGAEADPYPSNDPPELPAQMKADFRA